MNEKQIEERNELFDSAVREQMTGYEPQVPHALWNRISSELDRGEASDESTPIAAHHETRTIGKWRMAIAAAVLLTLTVGTLLYTQNPAHGVVSTGPVASAPKANVPVASQSATVSAPAPIATTHMVAQNSKPNQVKKTPSVMHTVVASNKNTDKIETVAAKTQPTAENNPVKDETAQNLEFAPVTTENHPVEVGNVPLAALNFGNTQNVVNDEITVIKSTEKKRKHGRKSDEESTKVILLGKKFDTKPDIRYQVPVRF